MIIIPRQEHVENKLLHFLNHIKQSVPATRDEVVTLKSYSDRHLTTDKGHVMIIDKKISNKKCNDNI